MRSKMRRIVRIVLLLVLAAGLGSCSPYASLGISAPFSVGGVVINPGIAFGFPL